MPHGRFWRRGHNWRWWRRESSADEFKRTGYALLNALTTQDIKGIGKMFSRLLSA